MNVPIALLLFALASVESDCDPKAFNPVCGGAGILQITEIMVDDCNRIVGEERWSYADRFDIVQSYEMAETYFDHYCDGYTAEQMARCWNQGHAGWLNNPSASDEYWEKVKSKIEEIR